MSEKKKNIADIRNEYKCQSLSEEQIAPTPFIQMDQWLQEALNADLYEPTAMTLATVSADNRPSSRILLLKGLSDQGLVFYTNYSSKKGTELAANPFAAINFFWPELERQVRIEGRIEKVSARESDAYFQSRPRGSQLGATVSPQSQVIPNRSFLENGIREAEKKYEGKEIRRPANWGGYILLPDFFEFWQGRPSRLHDRIAYMLQHGQWKIGRLAP